MLMPNAKAFIKKAAFKMAPRMTTLVSSARGRRLSHRLVRHFPAASVVAFDTDWWARASVREMSKINETPNVTVKMFCSLSWLARHLEQGALVISDCEGCEAELFCGEAIAAFTTATLMI